MLKKEKEMNQKEGRILLPRGSKMSLKKMDQARNKSDTCKRAPSTLRLHHKVTQEIGEGDASKAENEIRKLDNSFKYPAGITHTDIQRKFEQVDYPFYYAETEIKVDAKQEKWPCLKRRTEDQAEYVGIKKPRVEIKSETDKKVIENIAEKPNVDPTGLFFQSMYSTVRSFPPKLIAEVKVKVCSIIGELELRAITECQDNMYPTIYDFGQASVTNIQQCAQNSLTQSVD